MYLGLGPGLIQKIKNHDGVNKMKKPKPVVSQQSIHTKKDVFDKTSDNFNRKTKNTKPSCIEGESWIKFHPGGNPTKTFSSH